MFWKYQACNSFSNIEEMLQKEGVTLQELMDKDDIIQECKLQNKKLVDFLCQKNVLEELVTLITEEPSEELDERARFKYPNIACELLTCDVPALNESLSRDNELLEKLYLFMDRDPPLNPLLASFLSRTLGVLIVKRLDQAMGFLKDKENFISLLLKHLATSAIMDLTLKLITEVGEKEDRQNILNWLDSQRLVQSLIALFDPSVDSERQHNASQLICDVLRTSRETMLEHGDRTDADPILARLESPETVSQLLDHILGAEKSESSIVGGIQVLLALLGRKNSFSFNYVNCTYDELELERRQKLAQSTAQVILQRLKDFHNILLDPPKKPAVRTTLGVLDPPLGNTRLQVCKLLAALLTIKNEDIIREIANLGTIELLLDLFFKYGWNNFLHAEVQQCISAALTSHCKPNELESNICDNAVYPYLFIRCRLLGRILEAWDDNEQKQTKPKGIRQGYMGHLINIANDIVEQIDTNVSLEKFIKENVQNDTLEAWNNLVNGSLAEIRKTRQIVLGGIHPNSMPSEDSNDDYIPFHSQNPEHPPQMQQQAPETIENYSFHNDDFTDTDDSLHPLERRTNINLLSEAEMETQSELFKKVCSSHINTLDDADDSIFEDQTVTSQTIKPSSDSWDPHNPNVEDDASLAVTQMEVDAWPSSTTIDRSVLDSSDPWWDMELNTMTIAEDNWTDFGSFSANFDTPMKPESEETTDANKNNPSEKCEVMQTSNSEESAEASSVLIQNGADAEMKSAAADTPHSNSKVENQQSTPAVAETSDNQELPQNETCSSSSDSNMNLNPKCETASEGSTNVADTSADTSTPASDSSVDGGESV